MDLGVSSMQLDNSDRGFRMGGNSSLDMRMGDKKDGAISAAEWIHKLSEQELGKVIKMVQLKIHVFSLKFSGEETDITNK